MSPSPTRRLRELAHSWLGADARRGRSQEASGALDAGARAARSDPRSDDVLERYADRWEAPEHSMHRYVVLPPADDPGSVRSCSTLAEVRSRLELWYEDDATGEGRADDGGHPGHGGDADDGGDR